MVKDKAKTLYNSTSFSKKELLAGDWISQSEAARIRGVSQEAIAHLIKKGRFRVLRIADKVLLKRQEVETYKTKPTGRPRKVKRKT
jgi:excisionase family DNA binding protein